MTPKEALIKDGTIPVKAGKGRLSRAAIERCRELAAQGWNINGYSAGKPAEKSKSEKTVVRGEKVISDFVILHDEKDFIAVADKKTYSMREACNNCMVSLVQCHCGNPVILGNIKIRIEAK